MRNLRATLGALAIVLVGCNGNGSAAPIARRAVRAHCPLFLSGRRHPRLE